MSGVMEFKIYEDKLKHNILEMCKEEIDFRKLIGCLLYTSPSPRD